LTSFNLDRRSRTINLTASGRWDFLLFIVLLSAGCSSSSNKNACVDPGNFVYSADADSLSLSAFDALPVAEQKSRRVQAGHWLDRYATAEHPSAKINALSNAVGLAPDDPSVWVRQARLWRWLGNYLKTVESLDAAAQAVRNFEPGVHSWSKKEMQRQTALARSWLHYDRGEWQQGLDWAKAARQVAPGNVSVRQVYGLLAGHSGQRSEARGVADDITRSDEASSDASWILAAYRVSKNQHRQAYNLIMDLNPNRGHQAECWREMGEIAEVLGEYSQAGRWYEESVHTLPFRSSTCLTKVRHARLWPGAQRTWQKVWLAFDRYYVTGSYSAYTRLALERFQRLKGGENKDFWAGQVVNATGILLRKEIDKPWAYRARGLVFAYMGNPDRAIRDLKRASGLLKKLGRRDSKVASTLGHLYLEKENHNRALEYLQVAVELAPENAAVWRDYGLALIMSDQGPEAEEALTRALDLDPDSATSWYNRGLLYLHRQDYDRAVIDLEKAAGLAPGNAEVIKLLQKAKVLGRQKR